MRVAITGASGLIGRSLTAELLARGEQVIALTRDPAGSQIDPRAERSVWQNPTAEFPPSAALAGADAVIHLLGEPIDQRWSRRAKAEISASRTQSTRNLVAAIRRLPAGDRPQVLVSQSAIGFYGAHGSEPLDETAPAGQDFLARVVIAWEAEARAAEDLLRVVYTRTGVVLSAEGGALKKMLPIFRAGLGGPVGSGRQYMSWIHIADQAAALIHASRSEGLRGPVNLTAPSPVTNREFSKALGRVLGRPAVLPAPAPALKLAFGEMSGIVLSGQYVVPRKLTESGYRFAYPQLEGSLTELLS